MKSAPRKILSALAIFLFSLLIVSPANAAAPDGAGPWADSFLSTSQGMMKNGSPVPAVRSNPTAALGVAEDNTNDGNFYSLGFGGNIALGFDNGISSGVIVVEATNPNYPTEKAKVEVSENGTTWVTAGEVSQDGSVSKPNSVGCVKYVRITDISNPSDFPDEIADGYDVDGVKATGDPCTPPTSGGGGNCTTIVKQSNTTYSNTTVVNSINTGNNSSSFNTGGANTIVSGNSTSTTSVSTTGGNNTNTGSSCCCTGSTNVNISGNGVGSTNKVFVLSKSKKFKF